MRTQWSDCDEGVREWKQGQMQGEKQPLRYEVRRPFVNQLFAIPFSVGPQQVSEFR